MRLSPLNYQSVYERFIEIPHEWAVKLQQWSEISDGQVNALKHDISEKIKMYVDKLQPVYTLHDPEQMVILFVNRGVQDMTKFIALRQSGHKGEHGNERVWYLQVFLGDPQPVYKTSYFTINTDAPVDGGWNLHVLERQRPISHLMR